jgi:membrane protein DedA with SNARE-associated domain
MAASTQHLPAVIQTIAPLVDHYGYFAVGGLLLLENFGVPVPGETVLIAAAVFAGLGKLNILLVIIIAVFFSILGDNIGFAIGRYGGHPLLERYGKYIFLTKKRIAKTEAFYYRNGAKIILVARFIDGLRQANGIIAGLTEMKWQRFLTFNAIGATLWVITWSLIGYFGASHVATLLRYQLYLSIVIIGSSVGYFFYKRSKNKQNAPKPR